MTFGLTFTNNNDVVTLDSEFSRLVIVQSGRYSGGAAFSPAITTAEPPLVFVRPGRNDDFPVHHYQWRLWKLDWLFILVGWIWQLLLCCVQVTRACNLWT